ncbi:MAG TPA: hypothetical protein VIU93_04745 [Gallionellaceae bacterium]
MNRQFAGGESRHGITAAFDACKATADHTTQGIILDGDEIGSIQYQRVILHRDK